MKPTPSTSSHGVFDDPRAVGAIDSALLLSGDACRPLELDGVRLVCRHIHIGPGLIPRSRRGSRHVHDELQLEYAVFGQFRFRTQTEDVCIGPGDGLVVAQQLEHTWRAVKAGVLVGVLVDVEGRRADAFSRYVNGQAGGRFLRFSSKSDAGRIRRLLETLPGQDGRPWGADIAADALRVWLARSLADAIDLTDWARPTPAAASAKQIQRDAFHDRAARFLRANCCRPLRLRQIAAHLGVSPRHLSRLVRETLGDSVNAILMRMRLERSYDMLARDPSLLVKQAAFATGFASPAYFTHCFKKAFGCRPGDVRGREARAHGNGEAGASP